MLIAVSAETQSYEKHVAATPETVKKFIAAGCDVVLEKGDGAAANYSDANYVEKPRHELMSYCTLSQKLFL